MKNIEVIIILVMSTFSCCKHNVEVIKPKETDYYGKYLDSVTDFKYTQLKASCLIMGQYYSMDRLQEYPCFNPVNPYEIAYMEQWGGTRIYKFSFTTGLKTLVYDGGYYSTDWSSKGWIIFTNRDLQLWKVRDNGDSLTQLTNNGDFNNHAKWSPNGEKFAYAFRQTIRICKENGTIEKVIPQSPDGIIWQNDSVIIYSDYRNILSYNIVTDAEILLRSGDGMGMHVWDNNKRYSYHVLNKGTGKDDYYVRYDFDTQKIDTLRTLYDSYFFIHLTYHQQTKKCLAVLDRRDFKDSARCDIVYRRNLILMNPDGTDEKLIKIPE
jgi:dipeptidyl aminopeptidase/acylaminoacyl peptidase